MQTLNASSTIQRLPILLSGIGGTKLLGVPAIPLKSSESAGHLVATASFELVNAWNCKDYVVGMVFDNTSTQAAILEPKLLHV